MCDDKPQNMKGTSRSFSNPEELHRVLFEEAADGIFVTDLNGQLVAVNLRGIDLVGYSHEELLGMTAADLIPSEYPAQSPVRMNGLGEGWIETNERNIRRKDGSLIPVEIRARMLSDGSVVRIVRNISKHRQLETALRETEARLHALIDNLPVEFWAMDNNLRYIMQNATSLKNYGDVVGKRIEDLGIPPEVAAQWVEQDRKVLRGEILHEEYERDMEGEKRVFENLVAPVIVDEAIVGIVGVAMDITARKRAEEALLKAHEELEGRVEERTAELAATNKELENEIAEYKRMEEALRTSSEKLKLFAYSVIHDLKSPAVGIYGLTNLIYKRYRDALDENGQRLCEQILKAAEHVAALVDKVNVYIATKEGHLNIERLSPREILQLVKEEFSSKLSLRDVRWTEPAAMPEIRADRLSLVRAYRNLVENALKYGGDNLSEIAMGYEESQEFHVLSVSDNGVGIRGGDDEKIFAPFRRGESSKATEGVGLGLAIVREIAERHGGRVWVEPRQEGGTTFYMSLSKDL